MMRTPAFCCLLFMMTFYFALVYGVDSNFNDNLVYRCMSDAPSAKNCSLSVSWDIKSLSSIKIGCCYPRDGPNLTTAMCASTPLNCSSYGANWSFEAVELSDQNSNIAQIRNPVKLDYQLSGSDRPLSLTRSKRSSYRSSSYRSSSYRSSSYRSSLYRTSSSYGTTDYGAVGGGVGTSVVVIIIVIVIIVICCRRKRQQPQRPPAIMYNTPATVATVPMTHPVTHAYSAPAYPYGNPAAPVPYQVPPQYPPALPVIHQQQYLPPAAAPAIQYQLPATAPPYVVPSYVAPVGNAQASTANLVSNRLQRAVVNAAVDSTVGSIGDIGASCLDGGIDFSGFCE